MPLPHPLLAPNMKNIPVWIHFSCLAPFQAPYSTKHEKTGLSEHVFHVWCLSPHGLCPSTSVSTMTFFPLPSIPLTLWILMHIMKINGFIKHSHKSQLYEVSLWNRLWIFLYCQEKIMLKVEPSQSQNFCTKNSHLLYKRLLKHLLHIYITILNLNSSKSWKEWAYIWWNLYSRMTLDASERKSLQL